MKGRESETEKERGRNRERVYFHILFEYNLILQIMPGRQRFQVQRTAVSNTPDPPKISASPQNLCGILPCEGKAILPWIAFRHNRHNSPTSLALAGWAMRGLASEQSWLASVEDWLFKCTCVVWGGFGDSVWLCKFSRSAQVALW